MRLKIANTLYLSMALFNSILFVCVGNICRSPTAEFLLKEKLKANGDTKLNVSSAGINAVIGHNIDQTAEMVLLENSSLEAPIKHEARQLRSEIISANDLILVMENEHLNYICNLTPSARGKTFLLGKWNDEKEIPDPYRKSKEAFEFVYKLIDCSLDEWIQRL